MNALAGGKIAIVSDKPQTTRRRIAAVVNGDGYQLVLTDLPGFQRPRDALTERMQRTVDSSLEDVDAHLLVLAADEAIGAGDRFVAERVFASGRPVVIALNKVDRVKPARIAEQIQVAAEPRRLPCPPSGQRDAARGPRPAPRRPRRVSCPKARSTSARTRTTDLPLEARIAELVREQALALTREEIPHAIGVEVEELEEGRVHATVFVETESQKGILIGKGGTMIKAIGDGCEAGDRAPSRRPGLPRAAGQGAAALAS